MFNQPYTCYMFNRMYSKLLLCPTFSYYYFVPFIVVVSVAILCPDMKAKRNRQQTKTTEGNSIKEHQN